MNTRSLLWCWLALLAVTSHVSAEPWTFKDEFLPYLVKGVPNILKTQDKQTGRFGEGIWIVTDQNVMYLLAIAWSLKHPDNPHYHSAEILEAIMDAGDALIADQDATGQWEFRKKDGSTWGQIYMPWTYSRWARAYGLIKDAMPPERRAKWEKGLTLGFEGIAKGELNHMHNIPAHHAMGLYAAGKALDRPEWCAKSAEFMKKVVAAQDPGGFWSENKGPVVQYNFVYVDALGVYHAMSGDESVLRALTKASHFHANFTYPDGSDVETIDERNPYHDRITMPGVGFSFTPEGRGYIRRQWEKLRAKDQPLGAEQAASFLLFAQEGDAVAPGADQQFVLGDNDAMIVRRGPWFACLSAYTADVPKSRWIQDRQNFVSLFHDKAGVIVGGGNTKLQPLWSTFTVGDPALLKHTPGDEEPNFIPPAGIVHTPKRAAIDPQSQTLKLDYGGASGNVRVDLSDPAGAKLTFSVDSTPATRVEAHVTLLPAMKGSWKTQSGKSGMLGEPIVLAAGEAGAWFEHNGARVSLPPQAAVTWPVLPHNPYRKDGRAEPGEARIVITLPFGPDVLSHQLTVAVP
jgi:hypothetical protein